MVLKVGDYPGFLNQCTSGALKQCLLATSLWLADITLSEDKSAAQNFAKLKPQNIEHEKHVHDLPD